MSKRTPGSLQVGHDGSSRPIILTTDYSMLSISKFEAGNGRWGTYEEEESDCALFAAAPDLLDLIKRSRQKLATYVSVYPGDTELRHLLSDFDAAINKARLNDL